MPRARRQTAACLLIVGATAVAYRVTIASFIDLLGDDSPLAFLPLLPLVAVALAVWTLRRQVATPIRDRQFDLIVAIPLLAIALGLITVIPAAESTFYWADRPDVLSLAFYVAGALALVFGVGWLWRLRWPVLALFLMWPAAYVGPMAELLRSSTTATSSALGFLARHIGVAAVVPGDPSLMLVHVNGGGSVLVSIGSVCSGANSIMGIIVVGGLVLATVQGAAWRKIAWLGFAAALAFAGNLARLLSILALAAHGQSSFAVGAYHDVIGLVVFALELALALTALRLFGLRFQALRPGGLRAELAPAQADLPRETSALAPTRRAAAGWDARRIWSRTRFVLMLAAMTSGIGLADASLHDLAAFTGSAGTARLAAFHGGSGPTWSARRLGINDWAHDYFGQGSSFVRYIVGTSQLAAFVDVVDTYDKQTLATYSIESCFLFHAYDITGTRHIDLGRGVTGLLLDYRDPGTAHRWVTVSWAWPVRSSGSATMFERIVVTGDVAPDATEPDLTPPDAWRAAVLRFLDLFHAASRMGEDPQLQGPNARVLSLSRAIVTATVSVASKPATS